MNTLYIVATPIGHLADMSQRALDTLRNVDLIAAEDTRHSRHLLQHYAIATPMVSYHAHNEEACTKKLLGELQEGKSIALISDAGTPLISDPGYALIAAAHKANIKIVPIPGACAAITALSASALSSHHFVFEGFLPSKSMARKHRLQQLALETRTMVFYEAPHRIKEMLIAAAQTFGTQRGAMIARELTKTFETIRQSSLEALCAWLEEDIQQTKGEFVVIIAGASSKEITEIRQKQAKKILMELLPAISVKKAVQILMETLDLPKNELYELALELKVD